MGYQMPNVVKEIFLPFFGDIGEEYTLEEYRELTGIDLYEVFNVNIDDAEISFKSCAKIYVLIQNSDDYYLSKNIAIPCHYAERINNETVYGLKIVFGKDFAVSINVNKENNIKFIRWDEN